MELPHSFNSIINGYTWNRVTIGESSARTYCLQRNDQPTLYLKVDKKQPGRELLAEKRILEWLSGKLPVAEVLVFDEDEDDESDYLLISAIPGTNAADLCGSINDIGLVTLLAEGLRMIHGIAIDNCPFDRSLDRVIETAAYNVKNNLVDEDDFDDIRRGRKAEELFKELISLKPPDEDLVFTHGDYCLPNIMIYQKQISGFIDLHRAGIADRYKDIALAVRSIGRNLGPGLEQEFLNAYGVAEPDYKKIEYYMHPGRVLYNGQEVMAYRIRLFRTDIIMAKSATIVN